MVVAIGEVDDLGLKVAGQDTDLGKNPVLRVKCRRSTLPRLHRMIRCSAIHSRRRGSAIDGIRHIGPIVGHLDRHLRMIRSAEIRPIDSFITDTNV